VWYHIDDPFKTQYGMTRIKWYNLDFYPQTITDGLHKTIFSYTDVKKFVEQRKTVSAPVTISISSACTALSGKATITIKNTSNVSIDGILQVILKERGIKYIWGPNTFVDCVRDMLPNGNGEAITLAAGQSITKNRDFTLNSAWIKDSCRLVAFLQKQDKEVVEGCISGLNQGTPILTSSCVDRKTFEYRITPESLMLYVPGTGNSEVSLFDVQGRKTASFFQNGRSTWHRLPRAHMNTVIIIKIIDSNGVHVQKLLFLE